MVCKIWKWFSGNISIHKKLVISFSVLVSIPIITLGVYAFTLSNKNLIRQTDETMSNNLSRLVMEMESKFQRENDFMKFHAYNLELREVLESTPHNYEQIAKTLNQSVEPILWYFITSDTHIKKIKIFTPYVDRPIGSFLEPSDPYKSETWYQWHEENFNTVWRVEDDSLRASRTILDRATSSRLIGVMETEFYLMRFLEPVVSLNYLENGIRILDSDGNAIYTRSVERESVEKAVEKAIGVMQPGQERSDRKYIVKSALIPESGWEIYYYVDKEMISGQITDIISSTLIIVFLCVVLAIIFISFVSRTLSKRIMILKKQAEKIEAGNLENPCYTADTDEIGVVTNSLGKMTERLNETINQVYKIEIERKRAELKALQAMINPHFLYNCLSSIKWKALRKGDDEISEITGLVAKFYRTALNNGKQIASVQSEIENIRAYVEIQRATHDNSFDVEYEIEEEGLHYPMLNFLLQPIVENAIKHGIDYKDWLDRGKVKIIFCTRDEFLMFYIYNNGPRIDMEHLNESFNSSGAGYGIFNIRKRIEMYYGGECGIFASITEDGLTCFNVKIHKEVQSKNTK